VHHRTIQINHQPDATILQFIILTFVYSLTYFGRFPAHHQELNQEVSLPGVKRPGREAKLLDSFSALVQKRCATLSLPANAIASWTVTSPLAGTS
jgi:hypothetical protein